MRKIILAATAIAALAVPATSMANVVVNSDGSGSVGKGDVQNALSLKNDAAMSDWIAKNGQPKFGYTGAHTVDYAWTCPDGSDHKAHFAWPTSGSLSSTPVVNNGKTVSWNLTGTAGWPTYSAGGLTGDAPLMCGEEYNPDGTTIQQQGVVGDPITGLTVNGKPLAITPAL